MKQDKVYLIHILECIERIEQYTKEGQTSFEKPTLIQDGVMRNLQILGQPALKTSDDLKRQHPEINWKGIIGLRNVLVHDYLGIRLKRIWEIVANDLPDFKQKIVEILKSMKP